MPLFFGTVANKRTLCDVGLKSPTGERLQLCYRTETRCFLLGYAIRDTGYVLQPVNDEEHYYVLKSVTIRKYQQRGLLPTPLPSYHLSIADYLFGYSLWIFLGIAGMVNGGRWIVQRRQAAAVSAAPAAPTRRRRPPSHRRSRSSRPGEH